MLAGMHTKDMYIMCAVEHIFNHACVSELAKIGVFTESLVNVWMCADVIP